MSAFGKLLEFLGRLLGALGALLGALGKHLGCSWVVLEGLWGGLERTIWLQRGCKI